ncbi:MAG: helix-turn-helix transcriptional regulator [Candidatus Eisenbacteria bacterium]|uniref:Helix-turn-helix transcriptional regulator n=1 Tax=Eiseniibacteriota bacterium TaxID=2212470 RepID=A0A7Y2E6A4_UNCEI|nr:helix-turn-helix transcriptional regulator [Candidatus Eisenbacteria bacterium]
MLSKTDLGERIRVVRKQRRLTLKELEKTSGFSATHISEIERGKTSPTIGALVRIAKALGKEPSYFLEEEQLSEIAMVRRDERRSLPKETTKAAGEFLTPGIPGGRLNAYVLTLEAGDAKEYLYGSHPGEEGAYLLGGEVKFQVGDKSHVLVSGDAIHYPSDQPHGFQNMGTDTAQILLVSTKRVRKSGSSSGTTGKRS